MALRFQGRTAQAADAGGSPVRDLEESVFTTIFFPLRSYLSGFPLTVA